MTINQQKSDQHGQPSTINQKSSWVQCPQCLNGSESINNRTEQNLQLGNSGLSTNIERAERLSGNESTTLCSEASRSVTNPIDHRNEQNGTLTNSDDDSNFEPILNKMQLNKKCGNRKEALKNFEELEKMKSDQLLPSQQPSQVERQNSNTFDTDA